MSGLERCRRRGWEFSMREEIVECSWISIGCHAESPDNVKCRLARARGWISPLDHSELTKATDWFVSPSIQKVLKLLALAPCYPRRIHLYSATTTILTMAPTVFTSFFVYKNIPPIVSYLSFPEKNVIEKLFSNSIDHKKLVEIYENLIKLHSHFVYFGLIRLYRSLNQLP